MDNPVRNALRFNPPGQPIEIHAVREAGRIVLSVRDHGPGVADEHLAQLGSHSSALLGRKHLGTAWDWPSPDGRRNATAGT